MSYWSTSRCKVSTTSSSRPISCLKAHAPDVIKQLQEHREPMITTQNGEAKLVVQDSESYEASRQSLALFNVLALGQRQMEAGEVVEASTAVERIRCSRADRE